MPKLVIAVLLLHLSIGLGRHLQEHTDTSNVQTTATYATGAAGGGNDTLSKGGHTGRTLEGLGEWQLLWSDEFDGSALNMDWWSYDVGHGSAYGNNEQQYYTSGANAAVSDGELAITARQEPSPDEWPRYSSSRIHTKGKASWWPGMAVNGRVMERIRIDIRAKIPAGQGLWSAFWMLPDGYPGNVGAYGTWPASGEIDIMEAVNSADILYGHLHYGGWTGGNPPYIHKSPGVSTPLQMASGYHVYSIEWSADTITWLLDGKPYGSLVSAAVSPEWGWFTTNKGYPGSPSMDPDEFAQRPNAPFDQPFYLIINLSVGGGWPGPPDATTPMPSNLLVDWVRVAGL